MTRWIKRNYSLFISLLLITFLSALAYIPLIPFLGFYGDDFFFDYVGHFYGSSGLIKSLIIDRPLNGYLLASLYNILKDNVLFWHLSFFIIRLLGGYALFFLLYKIWPSKLSVITLISLFFLIYPGFLQQTSPLGYSIPIFNLTLWVFSLATTVLALKTHNKLKQGFLTLFSIILQMHSFLQFEFFIGIEALRLLIITLILKKRISFDTIKKTFIYWVPYIICIFVFVLWRIFIFKSTRSTTDINWVAQTYYSNPVWIAKIPFEIIFSFFQTTILAYFVPLIINIIRLPVEKLLVSILAGTISAIFFSFVFNKKSDDKNNKQSFNHQLIVISLLSILAAIIPIIISGRSVKVYSTYDRYTTTSIISVALLIVAFLFKFSYNIRSYFFPVLVFLSVTSHLMNGFYRMDYWNKQKDLWWQLYWRAPKIKNNALLILDFPAAETGVFKNIINTIQWNRFYWVDYQIWAPGNLFFNYNSSPQIHFNGDFLADKNILNKIKNPYSESILDRNMPLAKNFNNAVIISTPSNSSCLWVMDKNINEFPATSNNLLKSSIKYSDSSKLLSNESSSVNPPKEIFGKEPARNWCYYFQKASLARQLKDWDKIDQLTQEALSKGFRPKDINEWLPFIEGLIIKQKFSLAESLIKDNLNDDNFLSFKENICNMFSRLQNEHYKIYCQNI